MKPAARVLVIDDDEMERIFWDRKSQRSRYDLTFAFAETVAEVEASLADAAPTLILCDNRFPPFDDYRGVARIIRAVGYEGAIAVATASISGDCFKEISEHGVVAVIDKMALDAALLDRLLDEHGATTRERVVARDVSAGA